MVHQGRHRTAEPAPLPFSELIKEAAAAAFSYLGKNRKRNITSNMSRPKTEKFGGLSGEFSEGV